MKRTLIPDFNLLLVTGLVLAMTSCGVVRKKTTYGSRNNPSVSVPASPENTPENSLTDPVETAGYDVEAEAEDSAEDRSFKNEAQADAIIRTAMAYTGTRYKYGGTTKKGMDCSGLLYVAFGAHDFSIPRVSHEIAEIGRKIRV